MSETENDFRGPIGTAIEIYPEIQEAGVLLAMRIQYPPNVPANPPSIEAVLVRTADCLQLVEALKDAVVRWREEFGKR